MQSAGVDDDSRSRDDTEHLEDEGEPPCEEDPETNGEWYDATVTKIRNRKACFYVYYDFGEREWINLVAHSFRLLEEKLPAVVAPFDDQCKKQNALHASDPDEKSAMEEDEPEGDAKDVTVGSRVAIYWPEDQDYYMATVIRMRDGRKPHYLEFDDGEREWLDLKKILFYFVSREEEMDGEAEPTEEPEQKLKPQVEKDVLLPVVSHGQPDSAQNEQTTETMLQCTGDDTLKDEIVRKNTRTTETEISREQERGSRRREQIAVFETG